MWGGRRTLHEMLESPSHAGDAWQSSRRQQGQGKDPCGGSPPCCHACTGSRDRILAVKHLQNQPLSRPFAGAAAASAPCGPENGIRDYIFSRLLTESSKIEEEEADDDSMGKRWWKA